MAEAAYLAENLYSRFPTGTIHFITTNMYMERLMPIVLVHCESHYFIGVDNGVFSILFHQKDAQFRLLASQVDEDWNLIISGAIQQLTGGIAWNTIGTALEQLRQVKRPEPFIKESYVEGAVLFTDDFGNAITNIKQEQVSSVFDLSKVIISFGASHRIQGIKKSIAEAADHEPFAIFNAFGHLLLGMKNYNFSRLFDVKDGIKVALQAI